jgi:simple sugar transport system ATP-binding protein
MTNIIVPRVEMYGVKKSFGEVVALDGVDFEARKGEIHALLGENGAGKTTLMNILSGLYRLDEGQISIDQREVSIYSPLDAIKTGIGMVHQHVELISNFTALENILLGREGSRWKIDLDTHRDSAEKLAANYGLSIPLHEPVKSLPAGIQQKVEILKALYHGADTLILDEPTTMLTPKEVDGLFSTLKSLAEGGLTVIFITHKIKEVLDNCDRITVFRGGRKIDTISRETASREKLVQMMVGERGAPPENKRPAGPSTALDGPSILSVRDINTSAKWGVPLKNITFDIPRGLIVGLAGVSGNGQKELAEALAGLIDIDEGDIRLNGTEVSKLSVSARIARGVSLVPQDRIEEGILPSLSLSENFVLGLHPHIFKRRGIFERETANELARNAIREFNILAKNEHVPSAHLSGGNIQKMIVARSMMLSYKTGKNLMIANNPTRGLDIMAASFVHGRLDELRSHGAGVLLISEDLDELCLMCDRIIVIHSGEFFGSFDGPDYDTYQIGHLMAGQKLETSS